MATREACGKALAGLAKENRKILVLDADLSGSAKTGEVKKTTPEQHFSFGIAGGNMMTATVGMVTGGNIIFASTFAVFATGRAFEQVHNSICYPHLNVKACATYTRLAIGEDEVSHQSIEDVTLMRSIPGMVVVSPVGRVETKAAIRVVAEHDGPCYVRPDRMMVEDVYTEGMLNFQTGKGNVIRRGNSVVLTATDITMEAAMKAANIPKKNGVDVTAINMYTIKPIDEELITGLTKDRDLFITYEEYNVVGDLDSTVAEALSQRTSKKPAMVGIKDTLGGSGTPTTLLEKYGLIADDIVKAVEDNK